MKKFKFIFTVILFISCSICLFAEEKKIQDIEDLNVISLAATTDNSLVLLNVTNNEKWHSCIYAFNPEAKKGNWRIKKVWDKCDESGIGSIRTLVYSPFSDRFYFTVAWDSENEHYNGLYTVCSDKIKNSDYLDIKFLPLEIGLSYIIVNKQGVWLLKDQETFRGSYKYPWHYASLYQIEDEKGDFLLKEPENSKVIKSMSYWRAENVPRENIDKQPHSYSREYIFQTTDNVLLIRDIDNVSWWTYNCITKKSDLYKTYDEAQSAALLFDKEYLNDNEWRKTLSYITLMIIIFVSCLLLIFIVLFLVNRNIAKNKELNSVKSRNKMTFEIQEKERAKISRDIHDSVVQDIRVIRLETENLVVDESSKAKQSKIEDIATDCIIKLRNICYNLTPAELAIQNKNESSEFELISIINSLVQQFSSRTHFPCVFKVEEGFEYPVLERDTTQNLFRVIQEALTNIEKHSYATQASIFIKKENNNLLIYVTDDGIGCSQEELQKKLKRKDHLGLRSMMDRMELIGGTIEFFTAQDDGMEIKISLPLDNLSKTTESK